MVQGATDAAKSAAAIILTDPGLSPIFGSIVSSREIFRKVKTYVIYRVAASIFLVLSLCTLLYISSCSVASGKHEEKERKKKKKSRETN